ncbi:MAG: hypothetical protein JXA13_04600 [Anaerolineales bacterium]|nr:hypothetical protein [Anaerolineales bacterium]
MNLKQCKLLFMMAVSIFLVSCNLPKGAPPTQTEEVDFNTAAAITAAVRLTEIALTDLASAASPTVSPVPTNTPAPTHTPFANSTPVPVPCNRASFVADVNYPDGSEVDAGTNFTKVWRLKNNGSCTWTSGYRVIFDHGDQMNAPANIQLTSGSVAPGGTVDISMDMKAPGSAGEYEGHFMLRSADNIVFGINSDGQGSFWVNIIVPAATAAPAPSGPDLVITEMTVSTDPAQKGVPFDVTVKVKNKGDQDAGNFPVQWWSSWAVVACNWSVPSLAAGAETTLTCTYTYGGWSTYDIKAVADGGDLVDETNEGNNSKEAILKVLGP